MIIFSSYVEKQADAIPIILFLHIHIPSTRRFRLALTWSSRIVRAHHPRNLEDAVYDEAVGAKPAVSCRSINDLAHIAGAGRPKVYARLSPLTADTAAVFP